MDKTTKKPLVGIGLVKMLSDDEKGGIIIELRSDEEIYFHVQDLDPSAEVEAEDLEGQIVQYVRQETDVGAYATHISVLGKGPLSLESAPPPPRVRRKRRTTSERPIV